MITVIDETDEVSTDLLDTLLTSVKKENKVKVFSCFKLALSASTNLGYVLECFTNVLESFGEGS